jgi:hypothetical protein
MLKNVLLPMALVTLIGCDGSAVSVGGGKSTTQDLCLGVVEKIISDRADYFDVDEGLVIDLSELSAEELKCMPTSNAYVAGVETALKILEADAIDIDTDTVMGASVETTLKFAEAFGGVPNSYKLVASVETDLKFAEAVGMVTYVEKRVTFASVETFLKAEEASPVGDISVVAASVETYLKFEEAGDGPVTDYFKVRANSDTMLKLNEAIGRDAYDDYSSAAALTISGYWQHSFDEKGIVIAGTPFWSKTSTLFSKLGLTSTDLETDTENFLDKGFVLSGATSLDDSIIQALILTPTAVAVSSMLDKGVVIDPEILTVIGDLKIATNEDASRVLDKGLIIGDFDDETGFNGSRAMFQALIGDGNFALSDAILDKGWVGTKNATPFIQALLSNELATADQILDKGYHIEVRENVIVIRTAEEYLKYFETL